MKTTQSGTSSAEHNLQERGNAFVWIIFHVLAVHASVSKWLRWKRVCSWHNGYMGGNPFARNVTHGICLKCFKKEQAEIISHQ